MTKIKRFECACGQELWAEETARIDCRKCFGAFRLKAMPDVSPRVAALLKKMRADDKLGEADE